MKTKITIAFFVIILVTACSTNKLPVSKFYNYDQNFPISYSDSLIRDTTDYKLIDISYNSIHSETVSGLLTLPKNIEEPCPVIILLHGLGDKKTVDYIEYGNDMIYKTGFAVLRIDIANHGDRKKNDFKLNLKGENRYLSRDVVTQTVFDLRRAIDFIETRSELDSKKIGFLGISLGGIIGTIFCGVDKRVRVPVLVLAGGQLSLLYGEKKLLSDEKDFFSIIEPKNFVRQIAPRPLLMLNADNDDVIPPQMSKLLYNKAANPKEIIWYSAKHHTIPIDKVYKESIDWFKAHLK